MKSAIKISLAFIVLALLIATASFIGFFYNLSLELTLLVIAVFVFSFFILFFVDMEREKICSLKENAIICIITFFLFLCFFISYISYAKRMSEYLKINTSSVGEIDYRTTYVVEPIASLIKAMENYVESKLSNDEEKNYMKLNFFYTNKNVGRSDGGWVYYNESMTYPLHSFGGIICINDINSELCKLWLDRLVIEIKEDVRDQAEKKHKEQIKANQEQEANEKIIEKMNIFKKENKLN